MRATLIFCAVICTITVMVVSLWHYLKRRDFRRERDAVWAEVERYVHTPKKKGSDQ